MDAALLINLIEKIQFHADNAHVDIAFYDNSERDAVNLRDFASLLNGQRVADVGTDISSIMTTHNGRSIANIPLLPAKNI